MNQINDNNSIHTLSHTTWNCKYHIVFAPKYRKQVFYREKRQEIGKILRQLCEWKGIQTFPFLNQCFFNKSFKINTINDGCH